MDDVDLIRAYLTATTPGQLQLDQIGSFLADDVVVDDLLMSGVRGADAFVDALASTPSDESTRSTVQDVVGGHGVVAARILFEAPGIEVQFTQWFWIDDDRISRIQVIYDPRPFLAPDS